MSSTNVGSIHYDLDLKTDKFNQAQSVVKGKLKTVADTTATTGTSFGSMAKSAVGAMVAIGAAIGTTKIISSLIDTASELQSIRASFESMLGSAEAAKGVMKDLNDFSFKTAFSTEDINASAKTLLGMGIPASDLLKRMQEIGDVSGATGANLSALSLVSGQIFSQGKVQAQDYYQLINSGAGKLAQALRDEVAKKGFDNIRDAFDKGQVTAEDYFAALENANKQGSFAFNGAIKQADTFNGRLSNLKENLTNVGLKIMGVDKATGEVKEGGLFDRLSDSVNSLSNFLTSLGDKWNDLKTSVQPAVDLFNNGVKPVLEQVGGFIKDQFTTTMQSLKTTWDQLYETTKPYHDELKLLAQFIGAVLLGAIVVIGAAIVGLIVVGLKLLEWGAKAIAWLVNFGVMADQKMTQFRNAVWNAIKSAIDWFTGLPDRISSALGNMGSLLYNAGTAALQSLWNGMKDKWESVKKWVGGVADKIKSLKGPLAKDKVLLVNEGNAIMSGLDKGLKYGYRSVEKTVSGITASLASTTIPIQGVANTQQQSSDTRIYGNVNIGSQQDADYFFRRMNRNQDLLALGLTGVEL